MSKLSIKEQIIEDVITSNNHSYSLGLAIGYGDIGSDYDKKIKRQIEIDKLIKRIRDNISNLKEDDMKFADLFKKKADEAMTQVNHAECQLKKAQEKIDELKSTHKADLMKDEIKSLMEKAMNYSWDLGKISAYHQHNKVCSHDLTLTKKEIKELLKELCDLAKKVN